MDLKRIYKIIEPAEGGDKASRIFDISIILLIIINIFAVILNSFSNLTPGTAGVLDFIEIVSIVIFTAEYLLRLITAAYKFSHGKAWMPYLLYICSPMAVIDLLAILPFYLPFIIRVDLRVLRMLRLVRLLRILKLNRYTKSMKLLGRVIKRKKEELLVTVFITGILMLLASSMMYYIENESQPDAFSNIIASFWWAIATLTTVGYGDVYPVTFLGKIMAGLIAFLGIGLVALPTGIISSGFIEEVESRKMIRKGRSRVKIKRRKRKRRLEI